MSVQQGGEAEEPGTRTVNGMTKVLGAEGERTG